MMLLDTLGTLLDTPALRHSDVEECYITDGVSWEQYEALLADLGDRSGYRVRYIDGMVTIVAPSRRHESGKTRIGTLLEIYFLEMGIEYFPMGSTTLRLAERRGGIEPDESYCLGEERECPDLVIEVVVTSGGINSLPIYHRLGIQEVWFWQHERFTVYHFREVVPQQWVQTYGYEALSHSVLLPALDLELLAASVRQRNPLAAARAFRQRLQALRDPDTSTP